MNNLKTLRDKSGYTLQELGDMCLMSKSSMWEIENRETKLRLDSAYKIAKVLGVSVYDIWPDTNEIIETTIIIREIKQ